MDTLPLTQAINAVGLKPLSKACGVTYQALRKWEHAGRLPRTEWTGETDYASKIAKACLEANCPVTRESLLVIKHIAAGAVADGEALRKLHAEKVGATDALPNELQEAT